MMTGHNSRGKVFDDRILYTPSPFARASLLYLQEVGRLTALIPQTEGKVAVLSLLCGFGGQGEFSEYIFAAGTDHPRQADA